MFWDNKIGFYGLRLNDYIIEVEKGDFTYLPWIFCVLTEDSKKQKKVAASLLNKILSTSSVDDIYKIDKLMREKTSMEWNIDWDLINLESLLTKQMTNSEKRAIYAFASFNPNGYIREKAILALAKYEDTTPFILLRCNDWVNQIRQLAFNLLPKMLNKASNEEITFTISFMEKLHRSVRCEYNSILQIMVSSINSNNELIKQGLHSNDVRVRKFCINKLNGLDIINDNYLMKYIYNEKDCLLRKSIFRQLINSKGKIIDFRVLCNLFLEDKFPTNRSLALQYLYDNDTENVCDIAINKLMDKNTHVRALARSIVVSKNIDIDICQTYLNNLSLKPEISIYSLGEIGSKENCSLIETYLKDKSISIVRAAMISLMRLDSEKYVLYITDMLSTNQRGIVKTATILLKKNKCYNTEKIFEIQNSSTDENIKVKCASLLFLSSKWKSLIYVLKLIGSGYEELEFLCQMQINKWIFNYNRSYAILSEKEKQIIIELLNEKSQFLDDKIVKEIMFVIR